MNGFDIDPKLRNLLMEGAGYDLENLENLSDSTEETQEETQEETSQENLTEETEEVICCPLCEGELPEEMTNEQLYENFEDIVEFINQEALNEDEE